MQYYFMSEALANDIEVIGNAFANPDLLESEEIKLKPCPFCGGEAYFPTITKTFIECKSCGLETEYTEDTEWLVNTWNTRKPIEDIVKELEEWSFEAEIVIPSSDGYDETATRQIICTRNAIDIVRGSGVDNE